MLCLNLSNSARAFIMHGRADAEDARGHAHVDVYVLVV